MAIWADLDYLSDIGSFFMVGWVRGPKGMCVIYFLVTCEIRFVFPLYHLASVPDCYNSPCKIHFIFQHIYFTSAMCES